MSDKSHRAVSQSVAAWIIDHISTKKLSAGDRLPSEHEIAKLTGASRPAVREALQFLSGRSVVEVRAGKGSYVRDRRPTPAATSTLSTKAFEDLMETRLILEGEIAALAADRATSEDTARVEAFLKIVETRAASGAHVWRDAITLHRMISQCAHNHLLSEMLDGVLKKLVPLATRIEAEIPDRAVLDASLHRDLWSAIKTGDPITARAAMIAHIRYAGSLYLLPRELAAEARSGALSGNLTRATRRLRRS